jgi:hypothetical protein
VIEQDTARIDVDSGRLCQHDAGVLLMLERSVKSPRCWREKANPLPPGRVRVGINENCADRSRSPLAAPFLAAAPQTSRQILLRG